MRGLRRAARRTAVMFFGRHCLAPLITLQYLLLCERETLYRQPRRCGGRDSMPRRQVPRAHTLPAVLHGLGPFQVAYGCVPILDRVAAGQEQAFGVGVV